MSWIDLLKEFAPIAFAKLKELFRKKRIVIVGAGGVGKTSMGEAFAHRQSMLHLTPEYVESTNTEDKKAPQLKNAMLHVLAGQGHRRLSWDGILEEVKTGEVDGVIVVNAFGYHAIGPAGMQGERSYADFQATGDAEQFLQSYLLEKRTEEIEVLNHIAPLIRGRREKFWMLTVVTKEDLWFGESNEVHQHYLDGDYSRVIEGIRHSIGANAFQHEIAFVSQIIKDFAAPKFFGGEQLTLAKTNSDYSQEKQMKSLQQFVTKLTSLCHQGK